MSDASGRSRPKCQRQSIPLLLFSSILCSKLISWFSFGWKFPQRPQNWSSFAILRPYRDFVVMQPQKSLPYARPRLLSQWAFWSVDWRGLCVFSWKWKWLAKVKINTFKIVYFKLAFVGSRYSNYESPHWRKQFSKFNLDPSRVRFESEVVRNTAQRCHAHGDVISILLGAKCYLLFLG